MKRCTSTRKDWPCRMGAMLGLLLTGMAPAATVPYVVLVSLDGMGGQYLGPYVAGAPEQFPNFQRLQSEGAFTYNARCDYFYSETIPNHATMLTGRPALQPEGMPETVHHGYAKTVPGSTETFHANGNPAVPYKASFFDVAHDTGLTTAFYAGKTRLEICRRSYDTENGAPDVTGEDNGRNKIDAGLINDGPTSALVDDWVGLVGTNPPNLSFIHMVETDTVGHSSGWGSANWSNAVRTLDQQLGRIFQAIESSPLMSNQTMLLVTADHGGGGGTLTRHTQADHSANYAIPFFLWGPGIAGGTDAYALFSNRSDPGTDYQSYATTEQPIRDGDIGNLALSFLGLPPIPGSLMHPELISTRVRLTCLITGEGITLTWPALAGNYLLESTTSMRSPPAEWQPQTNGIVDDGVTKSFSLTSGLESARFYRLRKE